MEALTERELGRCSDRALAEHLGVSATFMGSVRRSLVTAGVIDTQSERIDRSGRKLETENIGSKPKPTPPPEQEIRSRIHELTTNDTEESLFLVGGAD